MFAKETKMFMAHEKLGQKISNVLFLKALIIGNNLKMNSLINSVDY